MRMRFVVTALALAFATTAAAEELWLFKPEERAAVVQFPGGSLAVKCEAAGPMLVVRTTRYLGRRGGAGRLLFLRVDDGRIEALRWRHQGNEATLEDSALVERVLGELAAGRSMALSTVNNDGEQRHYTVSLAEAGAQIEKLRTLCTVH